MTDLVINALKHTFVDNPTAGRIAVTYHLSGDAWGFAVSDNGIGRQAPGDDTGSRHRTISALVSQLDRQLV